MTGNVSTTPTIKPLLCDAADSQLVIIDMQTRLLNVISDAAALLKQCETLLRAAITLNINTILSEQYPNGLGPTDALLQQQLPKTIAPIEKTCFSCCGAAPFTQHLSEHNKSQIILCGIETHVCVLQTAMDLLQQHKHVFIVADAVGSRDNNNKNIALTRLQQAGAIITNTESVLFEWLKDAKHQHFKSISALIR